MKIMMGNITKDEMLNQMRNIVAEMNDETIKQIRENDKKKAEGN